jgi:hypothetical protein
MVMSGSSSMFVTLFHFVRFLIEVVLGFGHLGVRQQTTFNDDLSG